MFERIRQAARIIEGQAHRTPVMTSRTLNQMVGAEVYLKCENLQRVGAFKFRGAYHAVSRLTDAQKAKGVLTFSSGNHAQAMALTGRLLGVQTTVVMPDNAPEIKQTATRGYGAEVVLYDPEVETREALAQKLQQERGLTLVPPYDHIDIVAGQGTAALELIEEIGPLDTIMTPCGGGGLLSGTAIAAKGLCPDCRAIGVEPELADDATRSFHTKTLHTVNNPPTIADGTRTPSLGKITFPLVLQYVDDMITVSEHDITEAVRFLFNRLKIVVEPSGALAAAALLAGRIQNTGRTGIILSGGNIDGQTMSQILKGEL